MALCRPSSSRVTVPQLVDQRWCGGTASHYPDSDVRGRFDVIHFCAYNVQAQPGTDIMTFVESLVISGCAVTMTMGLLRP